MNKHQKIIAVTFSISGKGHFVHREWFKSVHADVVPYVPQKLLPLAKKVPILGILISLIYSIVYPKADVYVLDGIGAVTSVLLRRGKVIAINSDTFFRDVETMNPIRKFLSLLVVKRIDAYISTAPMMVGLANAHTKRPHRIVYPFVDVKKFSKIKPNLKSPHVCSIGIGNPKGTNKLIEAFETYKKEFPLAKLYLVGIVPPGDSYRVKKGKDVIMTGFTDPAQYLEKCGLYVNASVHESFGVNIAEAFCAGIPTILTDKCGIAEFVSDENMITTPNSSSLAKAMIAMQKQKSGKKEAISKKYRKIAQRFSMSNSNASFRKALYELTNE